MKCPQKTPAFRQGELFTTHDLTWSMLNEDQQKQTIELLSQLLLASLASQRQGLDQDSFQQTDKSENEP